MASHLPVGLGTASQPQRSHTWDSRGLTGTKNRVGVAWKQLQLRCQSALRTACRTLSRGEKGLSGRTPESQQRLHREWGGAGGGSPTPHASASATGLPPRAHTRVDPSSSSMATTSHSLVGASPLRGLCRVTSILLSPREASSHAASCPVEAPWHEAQGGISQWPSRN